MPSNWDWVHQLLEFQVMGPAMRGVPLAVIVGCAAAVLAAGSASAQQALPSGLISGEVAQAFTRNGAGWCAIQRGFSLIERTNANTAALVTFQNLIDFDGSNYNNLDGQVRLNFTSTTAGTVKFQAVGGAALGTFNTYSQTFNSLAYLVTFNLTMADGCTLAVAGKYEVAP